MASSKKDPLERLATGERVYLRHPARGDAGELASLVRASRDYLRPWVYPPSTAEGFRRYVERVAPDRFFPCLIGLRETDALVGVVNVSEIVRGVFLSAYLGFYGHAGYSGQGLVREGVGLLCRHAFRKAEASPARSERTARKPELTGARPGARVPEGGAVAAVPQDRGTVARSRAVGAAGGGCLEVGKGHKGLQRLQGLQRTKRSSFLMSLKSLQSFMSFSAAPAAPPPAPPCTGSPGQRGRGTAAKPTSSP